MELAAAFTCDRASTKSVASRLGKLFDEELSSYAKSMSLKFLSVDVSSLHHTSWPDKWHNDARSFVVIKGYCNSLSANHGE